MSGEAGRRRWRFYATAAGARPVTAFLLGLAEADRTEILAGMKVVERVGLVAARHLRGEIYEVQVASGGQSFRVLFAQEARRGQILLALEAFSKKTRRTPPATIALAEARLRDWRARRAVRRREDELS